MECEEPFYFDAKSHFYFLMRKVVSKGHLCKLLQIGEEEEMPRFHIRSSDEAAVAAAAVALHVVLFAVLVLLVAGLAHARAVVNEVVRAGI